MKKQISTLLPKEFVGQYSKQHKSKMQQAKVIRCKNRFLAEVFTLAYFVSVICAKSGLSPKEPDNIPVEIQAESDILSEKQIIRGSVKTYLELFHREENAESFFASLTISFDSSQAAKAVLLNYDPSTIHIFPLFICDSSSVPCNDWSIQSETSLKLKVDPVEKEKGGYKYTIKLNYQVKIVNSQKSGFYRVQHVDSQFSYISTNLRHRYGNRQAIPFFKDSTITTSVELVVFAPMNLQVLSNMPQITSDESTNSRKKAFEVTPQMSLDHLIVTLGHFEIDESNYESRVTVQVATLRRNNTLSQKILETALKSLKYFETKFRSHFPLKKFTLFVAGSSRNCSLFGWGHVTLEIDTPETEEKDPEYELFQTRSVISAVVSQWIGTLISFKSFRDTWPHEALVWFLFTNVAMSDLFSSQDRALRFFSHYKRLEQYINNLTDDISGSIDSNTSSRPFGCIIAFLGGRPSRMAEVFYTLKRLLEDEFWNFFRYLIEHNSYKAITFIKLTESLVEFVDANSELPPDVKVTAKMVLTSFSRSTDVYQINIQHEATIHDTTKNIEVAATVTQKRIEDNQTEVDIATIGPVKLAITYIGETRNQIDYISVLPRSRSEKFRIGLANGIIAGVYASTDASFYNLPGSVLSAMVEIGADKWLDPVNITELEGLVSLLGVSIKVKNIKITQAVTFIDQLFSHIVTKQDINQFLTASGRVVLKGVIDMFWEEKNYIAGLTAEQGQKKLETEFLRKAGWRYIYLRNQLEDYFGKDFGEDLEARISQGRLKRNIDKIIETIASSVPRKRRRRKVKIEEV